MRDKEARILYNISEYVKDGRSEQKMNRKVDGRCL